MRKYPEIKNKAGRIFLCIAFVCLAIQGCMKDSLAECGVSIRILYTLNPAHTDRLAEVGNFTVYIFDANGVFYDSRTVQGPFQDGRGYTVSFALHPGTYDFIVWGNLGDDYQLPAFVKGQTKEMDASLLLSNLQNSILRDSLADLYYGALLKQVVKPALQQNQIYTVDMIKDTKDVMVIAKGLKEGEDPLNTDLFNCYITSRNTGLNFLNRIYGAQMTYETDSYVEEGNFISEFTLLREMKDRSTESMLVVTMRVNGVERILFQRSLIDLLLAQMASTGQDLDLVDRFTIEINFDNYATTSIRINGWESIIIDEPL